MNDDFEAFCLVDPVFYDAPSAGPSETSLLAELQREVPPGWEASGSGIWTILRPPGAELPQQGWKIHISACAHNARKVLELTWDYCVSQGLWFKFVATPAAFMAQNAKYANRSGSGKFVTIYPVGEGELERTLTGLGALLRGEPGPYILSDLRWEDGPLYVRYGGFAFRLCRGEAGDSVPAIEDPDGRLVPDVRAPIFDPPGWVDIPSFLAPAVQGRHAEPETPFPYTVSEAIHYSNGGGVYLATERDTGRAVVVKEARPHAGLDGDAVDAVTRLHREHRILRALAGLDCVPEVYELRTHWEHLFLVEERIEGATLNEEMSRQHPLVRSAPDEGMVADYTRWALAVLDGLDRAVRAAHARGVVIGDLHPRNVIVRPDGSVCLIDFELGHLVDEPWSRALGAPGYAAPPDRTGFAVDRFALGAIRLSLFLPLLELVAWDPGKLDELIGAVERRFPVPAGFGAVVRRDLGTRPGATAAAGWGAVADPAWRDDIWPRHGLPHWERLRTSMAAAIRASATVGRTDRLFPGDPAQFSTGGLDMAHGAAGVLWALEETGAGVDDEHLQWLIGSLRHSGRPFPHLFGDGIPAGFYDGASGIAFALDRCGRRTEALELMGRLAGQPLDPDDPTLFSGAAGLGLTLLHFAQVTGDEAYLDLAVRLAAAGADTLERHPGQLRRTGLFRGWSGLALFLVRLHERIDRPALLDLARRALQADLDRCTWMDDTLQVDEGWRVLPYLDGGSAGIGLVLGELLAHRHDDELAARQDAIQRAASAEFVVQSGLFMGRAGLLLYLRSLRPVPAATIEAHVRSMAWHAVPYQGHLTFVGDQLARVSMDLATGSAGVLLALGAALAERPVTLPFLRPTPTAASAGQHSPSLLALPVGPPAFGRR